jgi:plasmid stabilization system protein ParE
MALAISWSKRADKRFDSIIENIEDRWGMHVASLFVRNTYDFLDLLSEYPEMGPLKTKI